MEFIEIESVAIERNLISVAWDEWCTTFVWWDFNVVENSLNGSDEEIQPIADGRCSFCEA